MQNWVDLERVSPGISQLDYNEHNAIYVFTVLWTIFEAQRLNEAASAQKIVDLVESIDESRLKESWLDDAFAYFCNRYVENNSIKYERFKHLNFRKNDHGKLVEEVLLSGGSSDKERLKVCLLIVFRFRNNLFHGLKWAYEMKGQQSNFITASGLLKNYLLKF